MGCYTESLMKEIENLSPADDDYEKRLIEVASMFRGFDKAFTEFIVDHGYTDDVSDVEEKAKFLRKQYKAAGIEVPREYKKYFTTDKKFRDRENVYMICFAFRLGVSETKDFFRRVLRERAFDLHTVNEVVYYFCMKNGLSYDEAKEILSQIPKLKKVKILPKQDILYTGTIENDIDSIKDKEKLIQYIKDNMDNFTYNNATAIQFIKMFWDNIAGEDGLAAKEGELIDKTNPFFFESKDTKDSKNNSKEDAEEKKRQKEKREKWKKEEYAVAIADSSTWTIFSQMIGLKNYQKKEYSINHGRSLSPVFEESILLPLKAYDCFPSRENIDNLLRGEVCGDNEVVRKMLIFLGFYTYWAKKIIEKNNVFYCATVNDSEACWAKINRYLSDAGYPELYAGNPYDWIFMWALNKEYPLEDFRMYIGEIFAIKEEQDNLDVSL